MKQKVMICAGSQAFEFDGEIIEMTNEYIVLKAKRGDIFIERKYLVFIQFLEDEEVVAPPMPEPVVAKQKEPKVDDAARFVSRRLKTDPVGQQLEAKLVPPSQFPDVEDGLEQLDDEDFEAVKNVLNYTHGPENPIVKAANLKHAIKIAMANADEDFSVGMGNVEYANPAKTVLGMKNAGRKKTTSS